MPATPAPATPAATPPAAYPAPVAVAPIASVAPVEAKKPPRESGPFFAEEPPEETRFAGGPRRDDPPRFSLGKGKFCFVDDAKCNASLIATADVGIGVNILSGAGSAPDLPYAQYNFRGGFVLKPLTLTKDKTWHPWGIGVAAGWSRGTGSPIIALETQHTDSARFFLVNQLWLAQKRNAFHLDVDFGIVRSYIRGRDGATPAFGTHASVSANWGGWGGIFLAGDFLYQDTRIVLGFRGHGIAAGPAIGLVLLGLLAGGAFQ